MTLNENSIITQRPIAPGIEPLIGKPFKLLDHGHLVVMDYMGNDAAIVQAARTSYQAGTKKITEDAGLLKYLMKNRHTTPYEMCEIKIHVRMPIFIARQWIRHRTASVNEMSARYSILPDKWYCPKPEHLAAQSKTNRQGRGAVLTGAEAQRAIETINAISRGAYDHYETLLNENIKGEILNSEYDGLARELARMVLPVNFYTEWVWKTDLHNLLGFLSLRADSHAQYEIRVYAEVLCDIVKAWCPMAYDAFEKHRKNSKTFSQPQIDALRDMLTGPVDIMDKNDTNYFFDTYGLSHKDLLEMTEKLGMLNDDR